MKQRDAIPTRRLSTTLLGIALTAFGCGGQVTVDDGATTTRGCDSPPEADIGSSEALEQAQCLIASKPESILVRMQTAPAYGGFVDGLGGWTFYFVESMDSSIHLVVEISAAQVSMNNETFQPCSEPITPFDSVDVAAAFASSVPPGFERDRLFIRKSRCPGYEDLQGLTHAITWDDGGTGIYFHGTFDDVGQVVETCGPCESFDPTGCGCGDK